MDALIRPVPVQLDRSASVIPAPAKIALREVSLDVRAGEHPSDHQGQRIREDHLDADAGRPKAPRRNGSSGARWVLGGTAVVLQHPESQVLGTRVADDVV